MEDAIIQVQKDVHAGTLTQKVKRALLWSGGFIMEEDTGPKTPANPNAREPLMSKDAPDSYEGPNYFEGCQVDADDTIDTEKYPMCSSGAGVLDCAKSLPPVLWLQQIFALGDRIELHTNKWYCPWCTRRDQDLNLTALVLRRELFRAGVEKLGFAMSSSESLCEKQAAEPEPMLVRQCIIERETLRLKSSPQDLENLKKVLWMKWMEEDEQLVQSALATDDFKPASDPWWTLSGLNGLWADWQRSRGFNSLASSYGFDESALLQECKEQLDNGKQSKILERVVSEVTNACNGTSNCSEVPESFCPEGTMCDCQRPWTPDRAAKAFGLTFWVVSPVTVSLIAGTSAFMTGGMSAIPGALWTAGWFPDYIPAAMAMALFSRKLFPECMCFEMACGLDTASGKCMMTPSSEARMSKNPFYNLPSNGLKCAHRGSDTSSCELQQCSDADVSTRVNGVDNNIFGKVGHVGMDLFNCASSHGTKASQIGFLDAIPAANGAMVSNTPESRAEFYGRYPINP
jgi:hypothetical protein